MKVKHLKVTEGKKVGIGKFPKLSGNITQWKEEHGKDALLVKCGYYIYNVTSHPEIYYNTPKRFIMIK